MGAIAFLAMNILSFHYFNVLPLAATGLYAFAALANFVAGFADEGSFHSCCSSAGGCMMFGACSIVWLMQAAATDYGKGALTMGLHFISFLFEVILIVVNFVFTNLGQSIDDAQN
jgi:hypothetical protein